MKFQKSKTDRLTDVLIYTGFGLFAFLCFFPFYYIIINTISDNTLVSAGKILFLPHGIHLENYKQVFLIKGLLNATVISLSRTVLGTAMSALAATVLGYAFSRPEYWKRKFWYRFLIITMYFNAGIIPWYLNMRMLGLINNFLAYILPAVCVPFYVILVKTYIESIPESLEEAAEIDGAGYLMRYLRIILPLTRPIIATIAIFAAVGQWNSFMDTVFLVTKKELYTLQFILYQYLNEANYLADQMRQNPNFINVAATYKLTPVAVRFTVSIITVMPILLVYPFFQKYFVKGIMIGAIKS
ncbi:MAG: carbohydrate ABC transporter permease [Clostridiaceae bacterium]|nr:carbohydrate ABC transporter permease [Clostridiaceae bacterium]